MKLTTKKLKELIVTKLLKEHEAAHEISCRRGGCAPDGVGYFNPDSWKRGKKCTLNSLSEEKEKLGYNFIGGPPLGFTVYIEYQKITFPCIYRDFIVDVEHFIGDDDDDCPDDTYLAIITDAKDENILAFGFSCD